MDFRRCLVYLSLLVAGVFLFSVPAAAEPVEDTQAPQLLELSVEPTEIDTSEAAQSVVFTAHMVDDVSGVNSAILRVQSPGGQQDAIAVFTRISGESTDGTFRGTANFSQFSELGTWEIVNVSLYDNAGNVRQLQNSDLVAAGFPSSVIVGSIASEPSVDAVAPDFGPEAGGTTVQISGSGFSNVTAVLFGPEPAAGFTVDSPTSIRANAPAGSGTVNVTVVTSGGVSESTPNDLFRFSPPVLLTSDLNPSHPGQFVTFGVEITPEAQGAPVPEGTVAFMDGGMVLAVANLNAEGKAKLKTKALGVGEHAIRVEYSGDSYFGPSQSPKLVQTVDKALASITLKSTHNPARYGKPATLRASVDAQQPGGASPTGTVTFFESGTPIATVPLAGKKFATYPLNELPPGAYEFYAAYSGDDEYEASVSTVLMQSIVP